MDETSWRAIGMRQMLSAVSTWVAHNGLRFDSKFIAATCHRYQLPTRQVQCIDFTVDGKENHRLTGMTCQNTA